MSYGAMNARKRMDPLVRFRVPGPLKEALDQETARLGVKTTDLARVALALGLDAQRRGLAALGEADNTTEVRL